MKALTKQEESLKKKVDLAFETSNYDIECLVLGHFFADQEETAYAFEEINEDFFFFPNNKLIFKIMHKLHLKGLTIDFSTVCNQLEKENSLQKIKGGDKYVLGLVNQIIFGSVNFPDYLRILKEYYFRNRLVYNLEIFKQKGLDFSLSSESFVDNMVQEFQKLSNHFHVFKRTISFDSQLEASFQEMIEIKNEKRISTNFLELDRITSGFGDDELIILAARPSMGKSALALNIAGKLLERQQKVLMVNLEMSTKATIKRLFQIKSQIKKNLQFAALTKKEKAILEDIRCEISVYPFTLLDCLNQTFNSMLMLIKETAKKEKQSLIIIDYLQLISLNKKLNNKNEEISFMTRQLKKLAVELKTPILLLSQLNRDVEKREKKMPFLSDLRDSGSIEQDADIVLLLYRNDKYTDDETKKDGLALIKVAKNRNGKTGQCALAYLEETLTFKTLENNFKQGGSYEY